MDLMPQISHCDYCNARAGAGRLEEVGMAHPITNAIDGSNRWWQSPAISNGREYNYVSVTLDLGLVGVYTLTKVDYAFNTVALVSSPESLQLTR